MTVCQYDGDSDDDDDYSGDDELSQLVFMSHLTP